LQELDDSLLINCLQYVLPSDILQIAQVSKRFHKIANSEYVWNSHINFLYQRLQQQFQFDQIQQQLTFFLPHNSQISPSIPIPSIQKYFQFYIFIKQHILEESIQSYNQDDSEAIIVTIYGTIYDLTSFANQHPGGKAILLEWNHQDATTMFHLANHSKIALEQAKQYVIWSNEQILGKKGIPYFIIRENEKEFFFA
jgi:hypothetical protein